jgi:3-keto-disaccharide hydrolase
MKKWMLLAGAITATALAAPSVAEEKASDKDNMPPPGFTALFNGKDLTNWQGLVEIHKRAKMSPEERKAAQEAADKKYLPHWTVQDGIILYDGKGNNLQTVKDYGNFELYVDWKIDKNGDSGIYLRGNPQVQIWDPNGKNNPKKIGSGGLYNNQKNPTDPLVLADNPPGQWNTFWIKMVGDKVTVKLNGKVVVDNTPLENYWERGKPLPARGPIELQHHGDHLWFKNIYVKELADEER